MRKAKVGRIALVYDSEGRFQRMKRQALALQNNQRQTFMLPLFTLIVGPLDSYSETFILLVSLSALNTLRCRAEPLQALSISCGQRVPAAKQTRFYRLAAAIG